MPRLGRGRPVEPFTYVRRLIGTTVRRFDGVADFLDVDNGLIFPFSNGAHSIGLVVKPESLASGECLFAFRGGASNVNRIVALYDAGGGEISWKDDDETLTTSGLGMTANDWQVVILTKSAGTSVPRGHRRLVPAGTMTHVNTSGSGTGVSTAVTKVTFGADAGAAFKDERIAIGFAFDRELSDTECDSIGDAIADVRALGPLALWAFNQASVATTVTDLTGNGADQVAITGTSVVLDEPPGFNFGPGGGITGSGGGSGTFSTRKGGLVAVTGSGGGTGTLSVRRGAASSVTASAGGSVALSGRKGALVALTGSGGGAAVFAAAKSGALTGSGGGSGSLTVRKGGVSALAGSAGGSAAIVDGKGGRGPLTGTGGGSGALSGAQTPAAGGIVATFLFGGGGRVGRSHPAVGVVPRGVVPLAAFNPEQRTGSLAASGGGSAMMAARKGGVSSTPVSIPAPPPIFIDLYLAPGLLGSGGGSFTYSYTRSAGRIGSVTGTAGGSATLTTRKSATTVLTGTAGGTGALADRKGGRSAITGTGGGSFTFSYLLSEARSGSLGASGGGSATFTIRKGASSTIAGHGAGSATLTARKGGVSSLAGSGGGTGTLTGSAGGRIVLGTVVGHGGGSGTFGAITGRVRAISGTGAGSGVFLEAKGGRGTVSGTGGGNGLFTLQRVAPFVARGYGASGGTIRGPSSGRLLSVAEGETIHA